MIVLDTSYVSLFQYPENPEASLAPSAEKAFGVPELADYREEIELAFTVAP